MLRQLNKNEFLRIRKGYENAREMYELGYDKECLFELRPVIKELEKKAIQTLLLARVLDLQANAFRNISQKKKAAQSWQRALEILEHIEDDSGLALQIQGELEKLQEKS